MCNACSQLYSVHNFHFCFVCFASFFLLSLFPFFQLLALKPLHPPLHCKLPQLRQEVHVPVSQPFSSTHPAQRHRLLVFLQLALAAEPCVAEVLRAGPVPPFMAPDCSPEIIAKFNRGIRSSSIVMRILRSLCKTLKERWEVVRVLRVGWSMVQRDDASPRTKPSVSSPESTLAAMLRLRGLGRFRPGREGSRYASCEGCVAFYVTLFSSSAMSLFRSCRTHYGAATIHCCRSPPRGVLRRPVDARGGRPPSIVSCCLGCCLGGCLMTDWSIGRLVD